MKFLVPAAAALIAAISFSAPAAAAPVAAPGPFAAEAAPQDRVVVRERTTVTTRRSNYRPRARRVCRTRYRYGKRIRTCRTVRRYR